MKTIRHTISQINTTGGSASMTITLPAPPWGVIEVDDRRETTPRAPMIRDKTYRLRDDRGMSITAHVGAKLDHLKKDYDAADDLVDMLRA